LSRSDHADHSFSSFFIIEHPSPRVVTHTPLKNESATANVNCRLLWLLDASNPAITIKDISKYHKDDFNDDD